MRILCLTDFSVRPPDRWLWNHPSGAHDQVDFLSSGSRDVSRGAGKLATRYPAFLALAQQAQRVVQTVSYDIIVAWESKVGLPLALLRRLQNRKHPPLLILAFAVKPPLTTVFAPLARWLLRNTYVAVPSGWEASWYADRVGILARKIVICPLGGYDVRAVVMAQQPVAHSSEPYIFSGGRSERDYPTFLKAISGLDVHTVINTRRYALRNLSASRIEVNDILPAEKYFALLMGASVVVLPLQKVKHAIGLTVAIDSMAAGRPLVCTDIPVLRDYVSNGETGLLTPPGDADSMRDAIRYLLDHPMEAEAMGHAARNRYEALFTFDAFADRVHKVIAQVVATGNLGT